MSLKITRENDKIAVESPYNPNLPKRARGMGGSWDATKKAWVFDAADEEHIKALYMDVYGEWENTESVRVRITAIDGFRGDFCESVYICGVQVARAFGRDSGARVCDAKFLSGLPTSGGSAKNWFTVIPEGSIFEIDIPETSLGKLEEEGESKGFKFEQIDTQARKEIYELMEQEREKLLARIAEIDAYLAVNKNRGE